jgi:hypothetical protein
VPTVALKDVPSNPTQVEVDDLVLLAGGDAKELTDDQLIRLKATGCKLDVDEPAKTSSRSGTTRGAASQS